MTVHFFAMAGIALLAGLVQGVTGFGSGTVQMMILPWFFPLNEAAGISGVVCCSLTAALFLKYRKFVQPKKVILPILLYTVGSYCSIAFSTTVDQALMKRVMGAFLILLSVYFLFIQKKKMERVGHVTAALFSVVSGISDGLFSIGGPLMVILFLARSDSKEEYLGNTQAHFFVTLVINCILRIRSGIIGAVHLPYMLIGIACIWLGGWLASFIADRINGEQLRKLVYLCVGLAGLINLTA